MGVVVEVLAVDPLQEAWPADLSIGSEALPKANPLVPIGLGLSALPKKLVARILVNEYINFPELPPVLLQYMQR